MEELKAVLYFGSEQPLDRMLGPNLSARDSLKKVDKTRVFIVAEEGVVSLRAKFAILPNVVENLDC